MPAQLPLDPFLWPFSLPQLLLSHWPSLFVFLVDMDTIVVAGLLDCSSQFPLGYLVKQTSVATNVVSLSTYFHSLSPG